MRDLAQFVGNNKEALAQSWALAISEMWPDQSYQPSLEWINIFLVLLEQQPTRRDDFVDFIKQQVKRGELQTLPLSGIIKRIQLFGELVGQFVDGKNDAILIRALEMIADVIYWASSSREAQDETDQEKPDWLIESASLLHFELTPNGNVIKCNKIAKQILGKTETGSFVRKLHPEDLPLFVRTFGLVNAGEPQIVELRIRNYNDQIHYLAMTMTPVHEQQSIGKIRVVASETTHERELQHALIKSEEKYRSLIEQSNDAIFIIALEDGRVLDINQRASKMTGKSKRELLEYDFLDLFPEQKIAAIDLLQTTIHQGAGDFRDMLLIGNISVEISAKVVEYGETRVLLAMVKDIGHRRSLEQQLSKLNSELIALRGDVEFYRREQSQMQSDAVVGIYARDIMESITEFLQEANKRIDPISDHLSGENLRSLLLTQDLATHWRSVCEDLSRLDDYFHLDIDAIELDRLLEIVLKVLIGAGHNVVTNVKEKRIPPVRNDNHAVERIVLGLLYYSSSISEFTEPVTVTRTARGNMALLEILMYVKDDFDFLTFQNLLTTNKTLAEKLGGSVLASVESERQKRITILLPFAADTQTALGDFDIIPFNLMDETEAEEESDVET